jgi:hypothetical protein
MRIVKIKKIIWGQFGSPCISIKRSKLQSPILLEILEKNANGERHYPHQYQITPEMTDEIHTYSWGEAYIIYLDQLEPYKPPLAEVLSTNEKREFIQLLKEQLI